MRHIDGIPNLLGRSKSHLAMHEHIRWRACFCRHHGWTTLMHCLAAGMARNGRTPPHKHTGRHVIARPICTIWVPLTDVSVGIHKARLMHRHVHANAGICIPIHERMQHCGQMHEAKQACADLRRPLHADAASAQTYTGKCRHMHRPMRADAQTYTSRFRPMYRPIRA